MCIFCDILEGKVEEIPWSGKDPKFSTKEGYTLIDLHPEWGYFGDERGAK